MKIVSRTGAALALLLSPLGLIAAPAAADPITFAGRYCFNLSFDEGIPEGTLRLGVTNYGESYYPVHGVIEHRPNFTPVHGTAALNGSELLITLDGSDALNLATTFTLTLDAGTLRGGFAEIYHTKLITSGTVDNNGIIIGTISGAVSGTTCP